MEFDFVKGEHVAIVGRNGSGKTLLVEKLRNRYPSDVEYISFRGTYGEEADGAYYLQLRWNRQELANHIELEDEAVDMFSLSSGELRKHRIARALKSSAQYLVIDNPYIGLDAPSRDVFTQMLSDVALDRTIILVMPGADIMPEFITHVAYVSDGNVEKMPVQDFSKALLDAEFPAERILEVENFPVKDLSAIRFYPKADCPEIVRCNSVSIKYDSRVILDSLDWIVREGECWAIRGENGSGKSTLLSLVCADNPQAYACDIELFGHKRGSGESIWDIKRHIGYVSPEMHRAYRKNISALEVVASGFFDTVGTYFHASDEQLDICRKWMWILGIEHLEERPYLRLSSGEQRLCLLARAFVKDPELLILDEPMHGLDKANCNLVRSVIEAFVRRPHKTLLFVTHFDEELPACINHTLMLKKNA